MDSKNQIVYIAGNGHSGSTLLEMLLSSHSQITGLGEVHKLYMSTIAKHYICTCGNYFTECSAWLGYSRELKWLLKSKDPKIIQKYINIVPSLLDKTPSRSTLEDFAAFLGSRLFWQWLSLVFKKMKAERTKINHSLSLFEAVRRTCATPIIVDCSKAPVRLKKLFLEANEPVKVIHLIRDGKAICYSRMRRTGCSMEESAKIWRKEEIRRYIMHFSILKHNIIHLRYEDLCRDPEKELSRVCEFLGVQYQVSMLSFRAQNIHSIGGNHMRFKTDDAGISLDEKWRRVLKLRDLHAFKRIAGWLNFLYGYDM